jgi:hypothetical protein
MKDFVTCHCMPSSQAQRRDQHPKNYPHRAGLHILALLRRALERRWSECGSNPNTSDP